MNKFVFTAVSVLTIFTSLFYLPLVNAVPYTDISVDVAHQMMTSGAYPNLVVLDVRTRDEFDTGHIPKALLIPHSELEQRIDELAEHKNHEIIVYCFCGYRSTLACNILDAHGFTKVYNMIGGINAWMGSGYPITTSYLTQIYFGLSPNPARTGQSALLRGILVDQFSSPVVNETVKLYYREICGTWHFACAINTNACGIFVANGKLQHAGIYEVCTYYAGRNATYEASYRFATLIVLP